jgi:hypothetical protein
MSEGDDESPYRKLTQEHVLMNETRRRGGVVVHLL